jgi:hypothetical protein
MEGFFFIGYMKADIPSPFTVMRIQSDLPFDPDTFKEYTGIATQAKSMKNLFSDTHYSVYSYHWSPIT